MTIPYKYDFFQNEELLSIQEQYGEKLKFQLLLNQPYSLKDTVNFESVWESRVKDWKVGYGGVEEVMRGSLTY